MPAVLEFGFNAATAFSGVKKLDQELVKLDSTMSKVGKGGGGGGSLSNVSSQMQDIAVQLQSGTKGATIFAQQGSQMLSSFGPAGAVAGMVAAIGGALYTGADASKAAFEQMTADMDAYRATLERTLSTVSVENVSASIETLTARINAAQAEQAKLYTESGQLFSFISSTFLGDKSAEEKTAALARMQFELGDAYGRMAEAAVNASAKQAQVAALRAAGDNQAAEALEREIALIQRRASIDAMALPGYAKDALKTDAEGIAAAAEKQKLLEAQARLDAERQALAFSELDTAEQIQAVQQRMNDLLIEEDSLRSQNKLDALAVVDIERRRIGLQGQLNQLQKRFGDEAQRAADATKRAAEEAARATERRNSAVMSTADEYAMLKAKGTRRKGDDYQVERDIAIRQRRDALMKENGMSYKEAEAMSTEMRDMEERNNNGGRAPKYRNTGRKKGMGSAGGGGLDEHLRKQGQPFGVNALPESQFDKLQREGFDWEKDLVPGGRANTMSSKHAANAAEPARASSLEDLLQKILTLLPKGIADALLSK